VLAEGGLIVVAVLIGRWVDAPPFARFRWSLGGLAWGIAATAPLLLGLRWCLATRWAPVARLVALVRERIGPSISGLGPARLALVALLAGLGEEALFRGVAQEALSGPLPGWAGLLAASALFGMAHWVSATYAVLAAAIGLYLGALFLLSGNLLVPIVTHALYDLVALCILARMKPVGPAPVLLE
jgi:membrane protease YdiL (CAAX protease family)